jgi:hypothetical protein
VAHALQNAVLSVVAVGIDGEQWCVANDAPRQRDTRCVLGRMPTDLDLEGRFSSLPIASCAAMSIPPISAINWFCVPK